VHLWIGELRQLGPTMTRIHTVGLTGSIALVASTAFAADIAAPDIIDPMPAPVAMTNWTGPYIGLSVGALWGLEGDDGFGECTLIDVEGEEFDCEELFDLEPTSGADFPLDVSFDDDDVSWLIDAHVGYDWQIGSFVIGALVDANWLVGEDDDGGDDDLLFDQDVLASDVYQLCLPFDCVVPGDLSEIDPLIDAEIHEDGLDWYGTARVRAGVAPGGGPFLIYATGGLAFGEAIGRSGIGGSAYFSQDEAFALFETTSATDAPDGCEFTGGDISDDNAIVCEIDGRSGDDDLDVGPTAGLGVDVLATDNFSLGLEWLWVGLGGDNDDDDEIEIGGETFDNPFADDDENDSFHTLSLKGSFRFGGRGG
jgi:outer membrane immunogenic protein